VKFLAGWSDSSWVAPIQRTFSGDSGNIQATFSGDSGNVQGRFSEPDYSGSILKSGRIKRGRLLASEKMVESLRRSLEGSECDISPPGGFERGSGWESERGSKPLARGGVKSEETSELLVTLEERSAPLVKLEERSEPLGQLEERSEPSGQMVNVQIGECNAGQSCGEVRKQQSLKTKRNGSNRALRKRNVRKSALRKGNKSKTEQIGRKRAVRKRDEKRNQANQKEKILKKYDESKTKRNKSGTKEPIKN
jgi:hypothetical protein